MDRGVQRFWPGSARPAYAGAVLGSLAAGAVWSWHYGLGGAGFGVLALAHAAFGLALGAFLAWAAPRARHAFATGLVASLALTGVAPALASPLIPSFPESAAGRELARVERRDALAERVAIIGLDGADWSVIDPMLAAGELPNLAAILARGRGAVLRSIEPIQSPVVWTSIFTGRPPHEHGIESWRRSHAANRRTGVLWEMAGAAGMASLVVNVPGTWPPTPIEGGLVSGFPMPGPLRRGRADPRLAQNTAIVVNEWKPRGSPGAAQAAPASGESLTAEVSLGGWIAPLHRWQHVAIDAAIRRGWLPLRQACVALERESGDPAALALEDQPVQLERSAWSPWLDTRGPGGGRLFVRMRGLGGDAVFLTPAFQDPRAPVHPYTSSSAVQGVVTREGMYVVEPTGWKSVGDPIMRDAIFEHLVDVEEMHLRASLALRAWRPDWRVAVHVITLPDRMSHAFWRFHRPADHPPSPAEELAAHRDKVARAYRESDRLLGELVAGLGPDTAVIVLSDHGFRSGGTRWGEHRIEGMLAAAGPGITRGADRLALSVYDVVPLALTLLGLPVAEDLAGEVPDALVADEARVRSVASYETTTDEPAAPASITETTEEQLRGLGYVE